ncbi:MAG: hypothetical protein O3A93_02500 [Chloroflexi bacterium]|nr:hypothetical protein [Chloroflexota bacterium]MDA1270118.1 hypothetical protein [Chloroflexota bacterium]PKB59038.1 MAG: hypothetical protein BZY83_03895 [SAR202 cluster bacterium Casp-Chloro-G2]
MEATVNWFRLKTCIKCQGDLAADEGDWLCLQCGTYYYTGLYQLNTQVDTLTNMAGPAPATGPVDQDIPAPNSPAQPEKAYSSAAAPHSPAPRFPAPPTIMAAAMGVAAAL